IQLHSETVVPHINHKLVRQLVLATARETGVSRQAANKISFPKLDSGFAARSHASRSPWPTPRTRARDLTRPQCPRGVNAKRSWSLSTAQKLFAAALRSSAEERLPGAHLPAELAVRLGGRGDVKSLAPHPR